MREQVTLDSVVAAELAGSGDAVLKALEGHLECDVFLRGNVLTLDGDGAAVAVGREVIRELAGLIARGHEIAPGTIEAVTSALDQHESPSTILGDVIWTHRGNRVAPKTVNQKRYEVQLQRLDLRRETAPTADVVTANLSADLLALVAGGWAARDARPGTVIASGFLPSEATRVALAMATAGLSERRRLERGEWAAMLLSP